MRCCDLYPHCWVYKLSLLTFQEKSILLGIFSHSHTDDRWNIGAESCNIFRIMYGELMRNIRLILIVACLFALLVTAYGSVLINEVEVNPPDGGSDWVELYNLGNESANVSGWTVVISDGGWVGKMEVPENTAIPAKGFYVLNGSSLWQHEDGGFATLYDQNGKKVDESAYREDSLNNNFAWGRHPDGHDTDTDGDWGLGMATKGRPNQL
jgi:hypothetical protein